MGQQRFRSRLDPKPNIDIEREFDALRQKRHLEQQHRVLICRHRERVQQENLHGKNVQKENVPQEDVQKEKMHEKKIYQKKIYRKKTYSNKMYRKKIYSKKMYKKKMYRKKVHGKNSSVISNINKSEKMYKCLKHPSF